MGGGRGAGTKKGRQAAWEQAGNSPWLHVKGLRVYANIGFNHAIVSVNYRSSRIYFRLAQHARPVVRFMSPFEIPRNSCAVRVVGRLIACLGRAGNPGRILEAGIDARLLPSLLMTSVGH
jgi:hypothetical protein